MRAYVLLIFFISVFSFAETIFQYKDENGDIIYSSVERNDLKIIKKYIYNNEPSEHLEMAVKLEELKKDSLISLVVSNKLYAPVEVLVTLSDISNVSNYLESINWIVPAQKTSNIFTLKPKDPQKPMKYQIKFQYVIGDPRSVATEKYKYTNAWNGVYRFSQGPNGSYSHFTPTSRYAIDIAMPVGTPIFASRGGIIVRTESNQPNRGSNPNGNFIRILHEDGTMGIYLHLQQHSLIVSEGQKVEKGQQIAKSGNTGRSTGPHLHFAVQQNKGMRLLSIPFNFFQN